LDQFKQVKKMGRYEKAQQEKEEVRDIKCKLEQDKLKE